MNYDVAQICLNGHVINPSSVRYPQHNQNFCSICGAKTIMKCNNCNTDIRGSYSIRRRTTNPYQPPQFCHHCGEPYPWTISKIQAAQELAKELDELTEEEKEILSKSIIEIIRDSQHTNVATTRIKKLMTKINKHGKAVLGNLLMDIASEPVKKILFEN